MKNIILAVALISSVLTISSCKKNKLEKSLNGTYVRTVDPGFTFTDSTTEVFAKASLIDYNRENEKFSWTVANTPPGSVKVETKKSDRFDDELELILDNPDWKLMLEAQAINGQIQYCVPNTSYLTQCRFYLSKVNDNQVRLSIVNGSGGERTYLYSKN